MVSLAASKAHDVGALDVARNREVANISVVNDSIHMVPLGEPRRHAFRTSCLKDIKKDKYLASALLMMRIV